VRVVAENPLTGECTHTNSAYVVLVALGDDGRPIQVPPLILETAEERRRWAEAEARQSRRLQRRQTKKASRQQRAKSR
jgi:acyl-CoA hydrolase